MSDQSEPTVAGYFLDKKNHMRKKVSDLSGKGFEAVEIATQVLRLCYPLRNVVAVHSYYNNEPIAPFVRAEHEGVEGRDQVPTEHVVVDVYFMFDDAYTTKSEDEAFVVEVAFPQGLERTRWAVARVRWCDMGWNARGQYSGDNPVEQLSGETLVNFWM